MSKGAQQSGSTTQTNTAPAWMYPYLGTGLQQASSLLQAGGPQVYSGQEVANFNPAQQQAMGGMFNLGMNGTPQLNQAANLDSTLMMGNGNPYENRMFNQAAQATQPQLASEFAGAGRNIVGSEPLRAQQLNQLATDYYGQNYQNTINNALNAGNQAQGLYNTALGGFDQALGIGNQVQNQSQNLINASMNQFNQAQQRPYQNLSQFFQYLNQSMPGSQQTNPYFTNPMANALGTGLAAQQLYNGYQNKGGMGGQNTQFSNGGPGGQIFQ